MISAPRGRSPSPGIPLAYLSTAALAFVIAAVGVLWLAPELAGHYYHPRLVALTHTVTLGWITLSIMGASYQLIPIVLERPIWSDRLARWQLGVVVVAVAGMVAHFHLGRWPGLVTSAGLLGTGVGLYLLNVALSLRGLVRWTFTARLAALGYAGLALTTLFGLTLGVDRAWKLLPGEFFPTLHAHAHLALLGWVTPLIFGVAARAYPMFLLAPEPRGWPVRLQLWGLSLGAPAVVLGLLGAPGLLVPGALAVAAAAAGHAAWVIEMVRGRKRPGLDWGLRFVLTATAFLAPAAALGLGLATGVLAGPRVALAYAVIVLGGWISLTIVGMMLKIVPFLVWYQVWSPRAGREPVPTLARLSWHRAEGAAYTLLASGIVLLAGSVAVGSPAGIRLAGAVLSLGALAFAAALARVLWHLAAPRGARLPAGEPARSPIAPR